MRNFLVSLVIGGLLVIPYQVAASAKVESRTGELVTRSSAPLVEERAARLTLTQIEALKQEISELRGVVEMQDHEIKQLRKSQQDFYLDLDKRLTQMQSGSTVSSVVKEPSLVIVSSEVTVELETPRILGSDGNISEKAAYESAYGLVRSRQYPEAVVAFQNFVARFPKGEHTANAYYWLGEVNMVQWQSDKSTQSIDKAKEAFLNVTTHFPTHQKITDALLKLGLIESEKGNMDAARQYLTEVKDRYPTTAAARIAETRLQQMHSQ